MVNYAAIPAKSHEEGSEATDNSIISSENESEEEDRDHPPTWSQKWSPSRSVIKKGSPVHVYTYKVNIQRLHSKYLICYGVIGHIISNFSSCVICYPTYSQNHHLIFWVIFSSLDELDP